MAKYVAFLRGVNVGGRIAKMDTLIEVFESLKLKNVRTFIQSGNVIFETATKNSSALRDKIEKKLESALGYEVKVIFRTIEEIESIIKLNPFKDKILNEDTRLFIALLYNAPGKEIKNLVDSFNNKKEYYSLVNNEVYCFIHRDKKKGFFSLLNLEKRLNIPLTTRQITTLKRLNILLNQ